MNLPSERSEQRGDRRGVLVWDAPLRTFHWLLVLSFSWAWLTAESERWRPVHISLGYTVAGMVAFRLLWGVIGPRHARFASFVRGPSAVMRYLRAIAAGRPERSVGHNPVGALAVVALLGLAILTTLAGYATDQAWGGHALEEVHEALASLMLALVGVHVAGVAVTSLLQRQNLVRAMITGRKDGEPGDAIRRAWGGVAVLMLAVVLGFWWRQWTDERTAVLSATGGHPPVQARAHHDDDDD